MQAVRGLILIGMAAVLAGTAWADATEWVWEYEDDFSTPKAQKDSYEHSVFWPEQAFPPAEPFLTFTDRFVEDPPGLLFSGFQGLPAHLSYQFPLEAAGARQVKGRIEFDVTIPPKSELNGPRGYMLLSWSGDGQVWTLPTAYGAGEHTVAVGSDQGAVYVTFLGSNAVLDNLEVRLSSPPATLYVPEDFVTIQAAIDAAADGDVIEVAASETPYTGPGNWDIDFLGKAITVRSAEGPQKTVIDCEDPTDGPDSFHRGFHFRRGETAASVLQGFTIIRGYLPGSEFDQEQPWTSAAAGRKRPIGAGIFCEKASPTIIDCVIQDCKAEVGAGIGIAGGSPSLTGCRVVKCRAGGFGNGRSGGYGAGMAVIGDASVSILRCEIADNQAYYNSLGGGLYVYNGQVKVLQSRIADNDAEGNVTGGGVYCAGRNAVAVLENCVVARNEGDAGAGIFARTSRVVAGQEGAGPGDTGSGVCQVVVKNCTVAHNALNPVMPPSPGAGIHADGCDISIRNSIVYFNQGPAIVLVNPRSNSSVNYCDVQGGYPGTENLDVDPRFASNGGGDYHLRSVYGRFDPESGDWVKDNIHSPCIDAGDPDDAYEKEPVPNGLRINMGAYGNTVQASMSKVWRTYHVDGVYGDDGNDGLTRETAFKTIQRGVEEAERNEVVLVWPAVYSEEVTIMGKWITLQSAADAAIIEAPGGVAISLIGAVDSMGVHRSATVRNFVIRDSETGITANFTSPTLTQLTVVGNGVGVAAYEASEPRIANSIFYRNRQADLYNCTAEYSWLVDDAGTEPSRSPGFADYDGGDYHLKSRRGRWSPTLGLWVLDAVDSPCLDGGNPRIVPLRERMPNGGRVNQGAFGGTPFASLSEWPLEHDSNRDGRVDLEDFADLAAEWLSQLPWTRPGPAVAIVTPYEGQAIPFAQETIVIEAVVEDTEGVIVVAEFYVNGMRVGVDEDAGDGWNFAWFGHTPGAFRIQVRVQNEAGEWGVSEPVEIQVEP